MRRMRAGRSFSVPRTPSGRSRLDNREEGDRARLIHRVRENSNGPSRRLPRCPYVDAPFGHPIGAVTASCGPTVSPGDDRGSQGQPSSGERRDSGRDATQTANCHCAYSSVAGRMFRRSPRQWPYTRRVRSSLADTSSRAMNRLGVTTTESAMQVGTLLEAAAEGDERAWSELVAQFHGLLWATARACGLSEADAADVTQTTWMRLAEHLGRITQPAALPGWLVSTTRREAICVSKRARRPPPAVLLGSLDLDDDHSAVDLLVAGRTPSGAARGVPPPGRTMPAAAGDVERRRSLLVRRDLEPGRHSDGQHRPDAPPLSHQARVNSWIVVTCHGRRKGDSGERRG